MGVAHVLDAIGNQLARGQGVKHTGMPHGDPVINGDGIEFGGKAAKFSDLFFDLLANFMEMDMTRQTG